MAPSPQPPVSAPDRELLSLLERAFARHAGADAILDLKELQVALGLRSEYLARRVLRAFDRDGDGVLRKDEFLAGVRALVFGTDRDKLLFAFRLHDDDGDGTIDRDELTRMIAIGLAESRTEERPTQPAERLAAAVFEKLDADGDGRISFDEFERAIARRPHLLARMTRAEAIWIAPNEELLAFVEARAPRSRDADLGRSLAPRLFLAGWIALNLAIFAWVLVSGIAGGEDPLMRVGRALGTCASFDGALILVPMMRKLLTRLRATWLGRVVPIDDAIDFHEIVGRALFGVALAHAGVFVAAFAKGHDAGSIAGMLFTTRVGLAGTLLVVVFAVMFAFSLSFVRRSQRFELFYFTHLLYVAWLVLAIVHAPQFLLWAGVPLLGFLVEQALRLRRRGRPTRIVSATALRSGVTRLEIARPEGFSAGAGDYVFLRIPAIAKHEWHPFTLSSAPERASLVVHVRSLGNWTSALRKHVEEGREPKAPIVHVDGPYGSPSAHIFESRRAVLIGAGIGVTPFASVLESLVLRGNGASDRPSKLESAYFFWLNRDAYSFEWFRALLSELEERDQRAMLEVHLCMTGGRAGATALGLELARDVMHGQGRSDVFTGLRTHTHVGAPDWASMLGAIAKRHAGERVDVYFCGPPGLADKLKPTCAQLGMRFREERF